MKQAKRQSILRHGQFEFEAPGYTFEIALPDDLSDHSSFEFQGLRSVWSNSSDRLPITDAVKPPPNGGLVAWTQVLVAHLLVVNGFGYVSSFGIFQSYYAEMFARPKSDISWVGSVQIFLLFLVGTFSGRAMDAGFFRSLVMAGCSLQLLGIFATSFCRKYWQLLLAQGITQGLGNGMLFTPLVTLVATYFSTKRAFALGLAACGAPTGGVIFPIVGRQLVPQIGFTWTVRIMGFVVLFNTIVILVLMRPRPIARPKGPIVDLGAFRDLSYSLFAVGLFLVLWGLYFAYYYITIFARSIIHVSESTSLTLVMVINGVGVPGRLIPALLADRYFGPFNTLIPCAAFAGILQFGWIGVHDLNGLFVFTAVYGFWANAVQTLFPATLSSLTTDVTKMGVRIGMVFTIISFACLTGPPIAGTLLQAHGGNFLYAQLYGGVTILGGSLTLAAARLMHARSAGSSRPVDV